MPVIEVHNISKRFYLRYTRDFLAAGVIKSLFRRHNQQEFWALRDISFSVERGESMAIIGPNGSGKTTLLSIISGVTKPTTGTINTQGRIAALLQLGAGFHPDLTGRENVYINAGVLGWRRKDINKIYPAIAEFSELGDFLDAPIRRYSSGMLSRLGFSIAIYVKPEILIVDEVLGVGDQYFQAKCKDKIHAFARQGVTLLFVSHSAAQVKQLCSQAVYLEKGKMEAYGDVDDVLIAYNSRGQDRSGKTSVKPAAQAAKSSSHTPTKIDEQAASKKLRPIKHAPSARLDRNYAGKSGITFFYRNGPQIEYLFDQVFPGLAASGIINVRCWGCSIGSEVYTLAIEYARRNISDYTLAIEGLDHDPGLILAAIQAEFNELEIFYKGMSAMPRELLDEYFTVNEDGYYTVRDTIRSGVRFGVADLLNDQAARLAPADLVLAQNMLLHCEADEARKAIANLVKHTSCGGILGLGGTDPDILVEAVHQYQLEPITDRIEEIHDGWRFRRSQSYTRFGLKKLDRTQRDWEIKYCSLFRKVKDLST